MVSKSFDEILNITKITLLLSGINVYTYKLNIITFILLKYCVYHFNFIWLHLAVLGEINWFIHGINNGDSFTELSLIAPCSTISILGTVKVHFLYYKKDVLIKIINKLNKIDPNNDMIDKFEDNTERDIMKQATTSLKTINYLLFFTFFPVLVMFSLSPLALMLYDYIMNGESTIRYPYMVRYFFDIYETKFWTAIYFHQVWATIIVVVNFCASDTLFYALCTYINMHFKLLCHHLETFVDQSHEKTRQNLRKAVKRHQELIELVNLTESLYSKSTLFNIISSSLLICLSGFNITVSKDLRIIMAFFTFLTMSLVQISLHCVFGDMIMSSSTGVSNAVYKCQWYNAEQDVKKDVLLILMRSSKPCKLTAANFADLNLRAFTTILSRSWSYFALLRTMYE